MIKVIKMDIYRLTKATSFKVCLIIVFLLNLISGPAEKLLFNLAKALVGEDSEAGKELGSFIFNYHLGNTIAAPLGAITTVILLLCIVWFSSADISHGYIKNIAGQLPSRGHTIVSKFVASQATIIIFIAAAIIGNCIGQLLIGRTFVMDMSYTGITSLSEPRTFPLYAAFGELAIKWILLTAICALILLFTTALGSNVIGTIVAVLSGAGLTGAAYAGISAGINALLRLKEGHEFSLADYMPDSIYHSNIINSDDVVRALIVGVVSVVLIMFFTVTLYNKKDIK